MDKEIWKEVFRTGVHTDAAGNEKEWSADDLDEIAHKYNAQLPEERHDAPVVVGHPVSNSPAYGWVEELKRDGDILMARFVQLDPEFQDLIEAGRYKKVSIALYPDMLLRHVGYLGAIPPAVKGLKDSEFNSNSGFISFGIEHCIKTEEWEQSDSYANALPMHSDASAIKGKEIKGKENIYYSPIKSGSIYGAYATAEDAHKESSAKEKKDKEKHPPYNPPLKEKEKKEIYISSPSKLSGFEDADNESNLRVKLINYSGGGMTEEYSKIFQELLTWLGQTFNEEIANQTAAELERMKGKLEIRNEEIGINKSKSEMNENLSIPDSQSQIPNSEEFLELQRKMEMLERDNRDMKFNEYFTSQSGRLVPAQRGIVKAAFEFANTSRGGFEFSENGKTVKASGEEIIRRLIESFPHQLEFSEIARKEFYEGGTSLDEQNRAIDEYYKGR